VQGGAGVSIPSVILDFETYYSKADKYTLRHLSYPEFIHDRRFKVHGVGVQEYGQEPRMVWAEDIADFLPTLDGKIVVVHNGFFDLGILAWHYDWRPSWVIDTLLLANHVLGSARDSGAGKNDLASLAERLELSVRKGDLSFADGVKELDEGERAVMEVYVKGDLLVTRGVLDKLLPRVTNRDFELWLADHTLRIYTDKPLPVDMDRVERDPEADRGPAGRAAEGGGRGTVRAGEQQAVPGGTDHTVSRCRYEAADETGQPPEGRQHAHDPRARQKRPRIHEAAGVGRDPRRGPDPRPAGGAERDQCP
jgi:hypothetical protein